MKTQTTDKENQDIVGNVGLIRDWAVFAPFGNEDPLPDVKELKGLPDELVLGQSRRSLKWVKPTRAQFDFTPFLGRAPKCFRQVAYVFIPLEVAEAQGISLGFGCDWKMRAWINGKLLLSDGDIVGEVFPPEIHEHRTTVPLQAGKNILALRFVAGKGSAVLAVGGPAELRSEDFRSVLEDPENSEPYWSRLTESASPRGWDAVEIGSRRELFIDNYLLEDWKGGAELKLHHPIPREVVMRFGVDGEPWEPTSVYQTFVQSEGSMRIYYSSVRSGTGGDTATDQITCVAESTDGIHFERPRLGLYDFEGSTANNIVWKGVGSHNFTPFLDSNPVCSEDARYKALGYHPGGSGLGAYASADGIHWRLMVEDPIITVGGMDSQNVAFWDTEAGLYREYHRCSRGYLPDDYFFGNRDIMTSVSDDFIRWSEPKMIEYDDDRLDEMYTNCIRPYSRAPHILIGTPARFVPKRRKVPGHSGYGVSDAVLITSRDGVNFRRWTEGFLRPGLEPQVWTDRNNYPAWGMLQLNPEEISIYWNEHYKHPHIRLRRGTIRTDGFVSLHAGAECPGEILTRPLIVTGNHLEVNYATSAIGTILFELCDEAGVAIEGFSMADCEVLFGNEISHILKWKGSVSDLGPLTERPLRLRIRLHDADLYAFRFC